MFSEKLATQEAQSLELELFPLKNYVKLMNQHRTRLLTSRNSTMRHGDNMRLLDGDLVEGRQTGKQRAC